MPGEDDGGLFAPTSLKRFLQFGAALLGIALVTTEVRQFFQGDILNFPRMDFVERGTYPIAWLALAAGFPALGTWRQNRAMDVLGQVLVWLGLAGAVAICALLFNPMLWHEKVGTIKILNWLGYVYGLPALAGGALAWLYGRDDNSAKRALAWAGGLSGLFLVFIFVTLEVQHFFRGDTLGIGPALPGEMPAYSLAWAGLGGIYLLAGVLSKSPAFRWSSLVMMLLAIFKVFLFDLTGLTDAMRVLSLAGLGISLMVLGFVYHRFVFRKEPATAEAAQ